MTEDVIDRLAGVAPGSRIDALRTQRPQARENAERSFRALFEPAEFGDVTRAERFALAVFVTALHRQPDFVAFYGEALNPDLCARVEAEAAQAAANGPYGDFPPGPLSRENVEGPLYRIPNEGRAALGGRLAAALEHAHNLVFHPRDASPAALQALLDAGWSTTGIVTLSQIVSFLSFQIRVVAGLRVLAATPAA